MLNKQKTTTLRIFTGLFVILILAYAASGTDTTLIEDVSISIGVSWDVEDNNELIYKQGQLIYGESNENTTSSDYIISSESLSIPKVREIRNSKLYKKHQSGFVRVYILSEKLATSSMRNLIDFTLVTPQISDKVYLSVCKGDALELLKYKDEKKVNAAEYIEGLIKTAPEYNFFKDQFTLLDIYKNIESEGKNAVLPYIEISEEGLKISGLALFKADKMIATTNIKEAKYINLLKFNKVNGMLSIQQGSKEYIDVLVKSKRKVKCYKSNDEYKFTIELDLKGENTGNELYKNLYKSSSEIKQFEKEMEKRIQEDCKVYIEKFKQQYKTDILDLGSCAAAKYGRDTGTDWNKVVSESNIDVKIKFKLEEQGRGDL